MAQLDQTLGSTQAQYCVIGFRPELGAQNVGFTLALLLGLSDVVSWLSKPLAF